MAKKVKNVLGSKAEYPWKKTQGMGTPLAEYSEAGPFSCGQCWYLQSAEPRKDPQGLCNEPHMLRDPKTEKTEEDGKTFAVVDKHHGCCRFIDPVKPTEPRAKFVFAGDSAEESEEHHEMSETAEEEKAEHAEGQSEADEEHEDEDEGEGSESE